MNQGTFKICELIVRLLSLQAFRVGTLEIEKQHTRLETFNSFDCFVKRHEAIGIRGYTALQGRNEICGVTDQQEAKGSGNEGLRSGIVRHFIRISSRANKRALKFEMFSSTVAFEEFVLRSLRASPFTNPI